MTNESESGRQVAAPFNQRPDCYKEAHETRRRWESYIWQWGILVTVTAALIMNATQLPNEFSLFQKLLMSVLTLFVASIWLNVYRARVLMKEIEKTIVQMHRDAGVEYKILPSEIDVGMSRIRRPSSTLVAVWCHFATFVVMLVFCVALWIGK
jgi:hypothetical protein